MMLITTATNHKTKKKKKTVFAISTATPAMPVNPSRAAIKAIIKNEIVQSNILTPIKIYDEVYCVMFCAKHAAQHDVAHF